MTGNGSYFIKQIIFYSFLTLFCNRMVAQVDDASFIQYYPFMDKLPHDYTYYKTAFNETKEIIQDSNVIWKEKEYPYWRYFTANIALLAPDSIIKEIWNVAYENSPYSFCDFYSWIFENRFNSEYLTGAPVAYFYLHHEKPYFDSICNALYSKYDSSLIMKMRIIVTDDHGRGKRELNQLQTSRDSINQLKITSILKSLGKYPGRSSVGQLQEVAWLVIQHAPSDYQKKYLPFIEKAVQSKDLDPKYLAYTIDRINMGNNVPQIYGTQYLQENNINVLYPVKDLQNVDALRKSVGLGPLKKYLEEIKIVLKQ